MTLQDQILNRYRRDPDYVGFTETANGNVNLWLAKMKGCWLMICCLPDGTVKAPKLEFTLPEVMDQ